jgi:hypothetical protein
MVRYALNTVAVDVLHSWIEKMGNQISRVEITNLRLSIGPIQNVADYDCGPRKWTLDLI